ncbi:bifunctional lysylphosphatidylglycerol flippase/synthetase MprF [Lacisediminihabitans sp. H27-G8]|uniref:bifunctional lysylphosphatidylglycerol flippase/synthetase MprF n=1 Tax=Lacisediminihabitans sp. H27-G8 TaxID=3111909 RepID=UPI0038FC52A3
MSISIAGLMLVLAFVTGSLLRGPRAGLRPLVGTGLDAFLQAHSLFSPITSVLFASGWFELLVSIAALVILVGAAERLMGWWRTLLAFIVTAYVGAGIGTLLQAAGLLAREVWAVRIQEFVVFDPFTAISGTILTASAFAGPLWRRRVRVLGFAALTIVFLYSGQPSDLFRIIAALAGLGLGMVLARTHPSARWARSSHYEARSLTAVLLMITAAGPFVSIFTPARYGPLHPLGMLFRDQLPRMQTVIHHCLGHATSPGCHLQLALASINGPGTVLLAPLPLIVLIVAALGMLRGRRSAALIAIAVNLFLALVAAFYYGFLPASGSDEVVSDYASGLEPVARLAVSVLVPLVIAALIAVNLRHFTVRIPRRSMVRFILTVVGTFVVLCGLYLGGGWLDRLQFRPAPSLLQLLLDLPDRFVPVGFLRLETVPFIPVAPFTRILYQGIGPAFWLVFIAATLPLFFSDRNRYSFAERDRARLLLLEGGGSIGHMALWDGNDYWFSADGHAAVAYRVVSGVALTTGGPLGRGEFAAEAVRQFAVFCDDNGWTPVFYSVDNEFQPQFQAMGWSTMVVAEETIVHPATFSTQGKSWQDVRSSINRAERLGVHAVWTSWAKLSIAHSAQIEAISESWVADKKLPELGFTLGGLDELRDPDVAVLLAVGDDDVVEAVTSWMPTYREGEIIGWTLDFMRRRPGSMNGVMEFLIASAALLMQQRGIEFMSLSAAPLARRESASEASDGTDRLLAFLARSLEPVYGFQSLFTFKQKFKPELKAMLMAYPDPLALPAIGAALGRAYLPSLSVSQTVRFLRGRG